MSVPTIGATVYRVVEYDPPSGEYTWMMATRRIKQDGKIVLDVAFHGGSRVLVPGACGYSFHLTPAGALAEFHAAKDCALRSAARMIAESKRAIAWAADASIALCAVTP